jgi:hypothetical protein
MWWCVRTCSTGLSVCVRESTSETSVKVRHLVLCNRFALDALYVNAVGFKSDRLQNFKCNCYTLLFCSVWLCVSVCLSVRLSCMSVCLSVVFNDL